MVRDYAHFNSLTNYLERLKYIPFSISQSMLPAIVIPLFLGLKYMNRKQIIICLAAVLYILLKFIFFPAYIERLFITSYFIFFIVGCSLITNQLEKKIEY